MAPVAMILGGISGTVSALCGWLLFGFSLWAAVQVYFIVGLFVMGMSRPTPRQQGKTANLQHI